MRSSNLKVIFLQKKFNEKTCEQNQIIQFLDEMNKSVELIYSDKKINLLLRDIYVFPETMKIIIGRCTFEIRYSEKIWNWCLREKYYSSRAVPGTYIVPNRYASFNELLEIIKDKLQEGLNELPKFMPYYKDKKYTLRLNMYV